MSLTPEQTSINTLLNQISDETFYSVIDRLKAQKALPSDSFPKEMPFFNFSAISKESQVKELYQDLSDPIMYKSLFKNILSLPDEKNSDLITKRLSAMQVMGFAQMILYKVLPCTCENCPNKPREVATQNQYKDYEYECPFYHHDKDQRRMVLAVNIEEEFVYKANYFEENKMPASEKDKCSQNYFESLFHPLYYKMFRCKRTHCNFSQFCPFFHSEEEKKTWDRTFSNFIRKDRISYVKDKQKYYEKKFQCNNSENKFMRAGVENKPNGYGNNNYNQNKQNYKPKYQKSQEQASPSGEQKTGGWRSQIGLSNANKDFGNQKREIYARKNSGESSDSNTSPVNFGKYYDNKENINIKRAC